MSDANYQHALALFDEGRHAEGARWLGQAAEAGHAPSMSLLGGQLLDGRGVPPDGPAGIRLILAAAERGEAFACATAATLFAYGFSGRSDWPRALDYLQHAAELGFRPAQDQLRLLSGDRAGTDWKALRNAVDIAAWRRLPAPQTLNAEPPIQAVPGLLSAEVCDALIGRARPLLAPATVYNDSAGGKTLGDLRRNSAAEFRVTDRDVVMLAVCDRLCALAGLPTNQAETCQVLHYEVGECFSPHFDFFDPNVAGHAAALAEGGQRTATVLVYLNDGLEGGETDFPMLGLRHRGGKGEGIVFRNLDSLGRPDYRTLHAGLPPTRGEKWLLSLWIRDRAPTCFGDPQHLAAMAGR
jgi:hypothetical protein